MTKENIFIPLYRSFGFRYLLATGIFEELQKNYQLIFFIDLDKEKFFKKYLDKYNPIYENINKYDKSNQNFQKLWAFMNILKKFFNGESKFFRNNSLKVWKIKYKKEIKNKPFFFLIYPIGYLLRKSFFLRQIFFKLEEFLDNKKDLSEFFKKYNPKLLILMSYGYDFDQYFVREAKKNKCISISIVYSWDNPSSKGYKSSDSDHYLVWNENMKQELIIFHDIKKEKIKICGTAHWDLFHNSLCEKENIKRNFLKENKLNEKTKIILFFSSSPRDFNNAYDKIDSICSELSSNPNYLLIARMHPLYMDENICIKYLGNNNEYFENKLKNKYKNLIFLNPEIIKFGQKTNEVFYPLEDLHTLKKLYCSADILLNEYSTTLLEGIIFDLLVINIAIGKYRDTNLPINFYDQHHHLWRLKKYKAILEAYNFKEIKNIIDNYYKGIDLTKDQRKNLLLNEININKGNASQSIRKEIEKIIN